MNIKIDQNRCIFVIGPHVDDGELGCGGTISKLISENNNIHFIVFSFAEKSIPQDLSKDTTQKEFFQSMQTLKIPKNNIHINNFEVRKFTEHRQDILEILYKLNKDFNPEMIFIPSLNDLHQDHEVVSKEALRAFKKSTIFCYEEPWNIIHFNFTLLIKLSATDIENKIKALKCYNSQKIRSYFKEDTILTLAKSRGTLIDHPYAEAFEVVRLVL